MERSKMLKLYNSSCVRARWHDYRKNAKAKQSIGALHKSKPIALKWGYAMTIGSSVETVIMDGSFPEPSSPTLLLSSGVRRDGRFVYGKILRAACTAE